MTPPVVIRPIWLPARSVNHRLPSGPAAIPKGSLAAVGTGNSVMTPPGVMRPIRLPALSVTQRLPSGPATIPAGPLAAAGSGKPVIDTPWAPDGDGAATRATHNAIPAMR